MKIASVEAIPIEVPRRKPCSGSFYRGPHAGVPHGTDIECFPDPEPDPLWASFITNRAPIKDGMIAVPHGPGFNLELDWDLVEKYRLDR